MLYPSEMEKVANLIESEYAEIEMRLIEKVVRSLAAGKAGSQVNAWRLQKLRQMGKLDNELTAYMSSEANRAMRRIEDAIEAAVGKSAEHDYADFKEAIDAGAVAHSKLALVGTDSKIVARYTESILRNCRTGLNLTNTKAIEIADSAFRDCVNRAWIDVRAGAKGLNEAVIDAAHELGRFGLTVSYVSDTGRHTVYPLDASVRRDLSTSLTRSTAGMALAQNEELGNDLVQVSTLADSRPTHAPYQGNVYSVSGRSRKYPPLSSTGYGTAAGLCGINCRHQLFPYFEELEGRHRNKTQDDEETKAYQDSQKQRQIERRIKAAKRQLAADEAAGADGETLRQSKRELDTARDTMRAFIRQTGRTRRPQREQV